MASDAPSEEEVSQARESILSDLAFNLRTPADVVSREAYYEFYGFPRDFLTTYQLKVRSVTREDVLRAAQAHLHPERMTVLIVGDQSGFEKPVASLGKVKTVDLGLGGGTGSGAPRGGDQ